jgi:hypothetical protein
VSHSNEVPNLQRSLSAMNLRREADGIREAIRLNWLEMERSGLSHADRLAIRANLTYLVKLIALASD